jgi:hypothetical protein
MNHLGLVERPLRGDAHGGCGRRSGETHRQKRRQGAPGRPHLIPIDRIAVDRPFYSGKHKRHGVNLQVIASPDGTILWVSGELPGSTHDTAAARIWNILAALEQAGLIALGDKGYHGYDQSRQRVITPYKGKNKPESLKDANRAHARLRGPGERANAQLKYWRVLHKVRVSPRRVGRLAKAIHVLQNYEVTAG